MRLGRLIKGLNIHDFRGDPELEIKGLAYDSRLVGPGYLFVALKGQTLDGHAFMKDAVQHGAVALVADEFQGFDGETAMVRVRDAREALSALSVKFYNEPYKGINLTGITGTNGKTTTSYLLESILLAAGKRPGVIGTINYRFPGQTLDAPVTTPESLDLMRILRNMADEGVTDVVMEVSSHALDQGRVRDCPFRTGIFTNFSRDHLDYHQSMKAYFDAKCLLFQDLKKWGPKNFTRAVINSDDPKAEDLTELIKVPIVTYGLGRDCDVRAEDVRVTGAGLTARLISTVGETDIRSGLIGDFNIYNILAAAAAALCMDLGLKQIVSGIEELKGVPGRLELVKNSRSLAIVVDYAHTPDALLKALKAVKPLVKGRLITVFGCGGDRDKGKRREMGRVAGEHSDLLFITSDNPRTEEPAAITSQIEKGVNDSGLKKLLNVPGNGLTGPGYILDLDRRNAIRMAVSVAGKNDLILIAGKGHEDYQIIGMDKRNFDDRKVAAEAASQEA
jgi:UDP-N-acetylmuramoyl-L-alanyl-D-glutamate--2,6-diaminopimelate ligase